MRCCLHENLLPSGLFNFADVRPMIPFLSERPTSRALTMPWDNHGSRPSLHFGEVDPIMGSTAAALLCTVLAQGMSSRPWELASETFCWVLLPLLPLVIQRWHVGASRAAASSASSSRSRCHASTASLWTVAAGLVIMVGYASEVGPIWLFVSVHTTSW